MLTRHAAPLPTSVSDCQEPPVTSSHSIAKQRMCFVLLFGSWCSMLRPKVIRRGLSLKANHMNQVSHSSLRLGPLRTLTVLIAFGLVLAGLVSAAGPADAAVAKWTVMVYISGDNNLEDYVVKDLEQELGVAGSNADVQIVAL